VTLLTTLTPCVVPSPIDARRLKASVTGFENNPWFGPRAAIAKQQDRITAKGPGTPADFGAAPRPAPDARFARKVNDYREIQDDDAYAGLFAERTSVAKTRLYSWRKQFEEENADVELPYERTSRWRRMVPNSFIRMMIRVRDSGIPDPNFFMAVMFFFLSGVLIFSYFSEASSGEHRDSTEIN
jgi:hypothetical protein